MAKQSGLGSKNHKPVGNIGCEITQQVTMRKTWAIWQEDHDSFLTGRGDLVSVDELAYWQEI